MNNLKSIIDFLTRLDENNRRDWFQEHKEEYVNAQAKFNAFTEQLIAGIAKFDKSIEGLTAKDCTYRIYRDTRFSSDKRPYKTHMGAFICPQGKKSGFSGYYFQIGAKDSDEYPGGNMLATGNYQFTPQALRILREDICNGEGDFELALRKAPLFQLDESGRLKRIPNGFPRDEAYSPYLAYRTYCLIYAPGKTFMMQNDVLEQTLAAFETTQPFLEYLNRAIEYAHDPQTGASTEGVRSLL